MSKDGTYRGGRRVRAGDKPDSLADKIASGRSARVFEPIDFEDEPSFGMDSSDFLDPVDLEGNQIPKPSEYLSSEQKDGKPLGADKIFEETWLWLKSVCKSKTSGILFSGFCEIHTMRRSNK